MAETTPTPFFLFSAAQIDRNVAALRDTFQSNHPRDPRVLRQQGVLQPLVPRPRAPHRHRHRGQLRRRAVEGETGRLRAAADRLQRRRQDARRDRGRPAAAHRGDRRRLRVRAAARRRRGRRPRSRGARRPARRPQRRQRDTPGPAHQQGGQGRHRRQRGARRLRSGRPAARTSKLVGMHYHIGSQITTVEPYIEALDWPWPARAHRDRPRHPLEHLNIGGGFAIPYYDRMRRRARHLLRGAAHARGLRVGDRRAAAVPRAPTSSSTSSPDAPSPATRPSSSVASRPRRRSSSRPPTGASRARTG